MDNNELSQFIDQQRWLLNNGLIPESVKNQLFFYGSIVHKDVQAVEVIIKPENKLVEYIIYVNKRVLNKIDKYKKLSAATSLFGMWRFKRFLQKEGSLDFHGILQAFVTDFCGPQWAVTVALSDFDAYVDSIGDESEADKRGQQSNQLPD